MESLLLMNVASDEKHVTVERLMAMPGVINAYPVYGIFDIVAVVKVEDIGSYQRLLKERISEIMLITALLPHAKEVDIMRVEQPWLLE